MPPDVGRDGGVGRCGGRVVARSEALSEARGASSLASASVVRVAPTLAPASGHKGNAPDCPFTAHMPGAGLALGGDGAEASHTAPTFVRVLAPSDSEKANVRLLWGRGGEVLERPVRLFAVIKTNLFAI